ncbi:MAG TPA: prolyl oligopeptidase family serine peptidase [Candidatus Dormibacteraeota bacterium]
MLADRYLTAARAYAPVPAPDGSLWFASDLAGHTQLFRIAGPESWPQRVVPTSDRILPIGITPGGLLVRTDRGGNETWRLGLISAAGEWRALTRDTKAMHLSPTLSPDQKRAGLSFNPGGRVDFALGVIDLESGDIETWAECPGMWRWAAWSPDGERALVEHVISPTRVETYLLARGGDLQPVLPEARRIFDAAWAHGRMLALSDLGSEFIRLVDAASGTPVYDAPGRDLRMWLPDPTGARAAIAINAGAYDELVIVDLSDGRELQRLEPPGGPGVVHADNVTEPGLNAAWSPDGDRLFVAWDTPIAPADIYELPSGRRWTAAGTSAPPNGIRPEAVSYRSFDGLEIPALHYRAPSPNGQRKTIVHIHGGPEGQARGNYIPHVQLLLAGGLDVLMPNVRGSTGYGVRYFSLDDRELRWDSVRDGCEAARWLKATAGSDRVAAMGASYGGFMTLAVLVEDPDLWDAGVDIVGIADWHTFFKNTSAWRRALRAVEYGDPDQPNDAEFLAEFSPLRRAHAIRAPLLVIHGRNDVRVPLNEAEQMAAATSAELLVFDDEGHGVVRHGNRVRAYGRALEFLLEKLG